jgi:hypothetical protein
MGSGLGVTRVRSGGRSEHNEVGSLTTGDTAKGPRNRAAPLGHDVGAARPRVTLVTEDGFGLTLACRPAPRLWHRKQRVRVDAGQRQAGIAKRGKCGAKRDRVAGLRGPVAADEDTVKSGTLVPAGHDRTPTPTSVPVRLPVQLLSTLRRPSRFAPGEDAGEVQRRKEPHRLFRVRVDDDDVAGAVREHQLACLTQ